MILRLGLVVALLVLSSCQPTTRSKPIDPEASNRVAAALMQIGVLDTTLDVVVATAAVYANGMLDSAVAPAPSMREGFVIVNRQPMNGKVCVYVVDSHRLAQMGAGDVGGIRADALAAMLKGNALALPSNVLLIDAALVQLITLETASAVLKQMQIDDPGALAELPLGAHPEHITESLMALGRYYRLGNIGLYFDALEHGDGELRTQAAQSLEAVGGAVRPYLHLGLMPLLAHELAHLGLGHGGHYLRDTRRAARDRQRIGEERQADSLAVTAMIRSNRVLRGVLARLPRRAPAARLLEWSLMAPFEYSQLMRDLALYPVFHDYRSVHAQDYFVNIVNAYPVDPRYRNEAPYRFERVLYAEEMLPPLVGWRHREDVAAKLRREAGGATHEHLFQRMNAIAESTGMDVAGVAGLGATMSPYLDYMDDPAVAEERMARARAANGYTTRTAMDSVVARIGWPKVDVPCGADCRAVVMTSPRDSVSYIEAIGWRGRVVWLRWFGRVPRMEEVRGGMLEEFFEGPLMAWIAMRPKAVDSTRWFEAYMDMYSEARTLGAVGIADTVFDREVCVRSFPGSRYMMILFRGIEAEKSTWTPLISDSEVRRLAKSLRAEMGTDSE